jgi:DEAD/DEAH box helicase domain-containing protein
MPDKRATVEAALDSLPGAAVTDRFVEESEAATTHAVSDVLEEPLSTTAPVSQLYAHQARALAELQSGKNVCVATPTASGKTLIYTLEIARQYHLSDGDSTALLVYPTKALARDQQAQLEETLQALFKPTAIEPPSVDVYDGDVSRTRKEEVRESSEVVITNIPELNAVLPHHEGWEGFYSELETVVIDEAHTYSGVQGTHAAWIFRRLQRVADSYGAMPQFISTSATIGNAREHAQRLTGRDTVTVTESGAPRPRRHQYFLAKDDGESHSGSALETASAVLAELAEAGLQALLFTDSRKLAESHASIAGRQTSAEVAAYHGGHRKAERRAVEQKLSEGIVRGVSTTSALEVGINVGTVDAIILSGYPGSRQSWRQRLGRAGREGRPAFGIYVPHDSPIDTYVRENPEYILDEPAEKAVVDLQNNSVYASHLRASAREHPLTTADRSWFGDRLPAAAAMYRAGNELIGALDGEGMKLASSNKPELGIDIYGGTQASVDVFLHSESGEQLRLPSVTPLRAYRDLHPGAIYRHQGDRYRVTEFDEAKERVTLHPFDGDYETEVISQTAIESVEPGGRTHVDSGGVEIVRGGVSLTTYFPAYEKVNPTTGVTKGQEETELTGARTLQTQGLWVRERAASDDSDDTPGGDGIQAETMATAGEAITNLLGTQVLVPDDAVKATVGTLPASEERVLLLYDDVTGGIGVADRLFESISDLSGLAYERLTGCPCDKGCPQCVGRAQIDSGSGSNKKGAIQLLDRLTN